MSFVCTNSPGFPIPNLFRRCYSILLLLIMGKTSLEQTVKVDMECDLQLTVVFSGVSLVSVKKQALTAIWLFRFPRIMLQGVQRQFVGLHVHA